MNLSSTRVRRAAQIAMGVGAVVIIATLFSLWRGGSSDNQSAVGNDPAAFLPYESGGVQSDSATSNAGKNPLKAGPKDPFAFSFGTTALQDVVLSARSDGDIYLGYLFRADLGGVKVVPRSFSFKRTVRGPSPAVLFAVEGLSGASYVTCTISVNGRQIKSSTVRGEGKIAVCLG
ncbi:hypothetical protein [Aeromicrobium sp.]|uniref:hypothetical protein n=1 Tax=Aeromicrobium sp. TaxID=1871063 RepID=UPI001982A7F9|nr:hypothetical protein [Aeromicrobium sp.]MBC7632482.1 hypothetical protein [Aeromicrobium sp.]